ncbi:ribosomal protein S18-alanine N-acetyltransferase [Burkholderiaceae bacterium DAT-1]|nr:ribosomal protein S18-alanine N-acetyltransferase [Burkholderiaceae bacterium DAT-1]
MIIRAMTPADVPAVATIEAALQYHPWNAAQFLESLQSQHPSWVVDVNGEICGFAVAMQVLDEATLLEVGIAPAHQGKGWGKLLVQEVIDAASESGMAVMHLEVRIANKVARQLYKRLGFQEVGKRRGYYRAPITEATPDGREDAILMALTLDEGAR